MSGPQIALLDEGRRLHLQHGPIDLIVGVDGADARARAFDAAIVRFEPLLEGLVVELEQHRAPLTPNMVAPNDAVGQRMYEAALPYCDSIFVTPMIAVAGSVADEILTAMKASGPLEKAYVNNGGDIALYLSGDAIFKIGMAGITGHCLGDITLNAAQQIGGVATSGAYGRSHSLGIADCVTVLASNAAAADATATLIANAVDVPGLESIQRIAADELKPDSDLGSQLVTTFVPPLNEVQIQQALNAGYERALEFFYEGRIKAAALFLQGQSISVGDFTKLSKPKAEMEYA